MKKHVDVAAAIVAVNGEVLCMQRGIGKSPSTSMKWEFPGGKVEKGETPQQTIVRELMEEMDYEVVPLHRLAKVYYEYPDFTITLDAWLCKASTQHFNMKEHIAYRWLKPQDVASLDFAAADSNIIEKIKDITFLPNDFE
ncbi:MAG: (deoxy)nucleoside triphosphate pyrophosphohydrolase [Bacteroidales bacterium]|nr:(deoxy)nucleoside triphosphate pyrophosphohydrolase [Bacteroidales bacterium]